MNVRSCKYILGVNRKSTHNAVMAEVGHLPIQLSVLLNILKYWITLEKSEDILLKEALALSKSLHEKGHTSWYSYIVKVLELQDLTPDSLLRKSKYCIKKVVMGKLKGLYIKEWKN